MAGPTLPPTLSRRRPHPSGDEQATTNLRLGDMDNTPALSVAECKVLLDQLASRQGARPTSQSDVYVKTREYVDVFARFKDPKTVTQVDAITAGLLNRGLGHYERAQLGELCLSLYEEGGGKEGGQAGRLCAGGETFAGKDFVADKLFDLATLCCDTPDEARTLIPSLETKLSDDELQDILNDITNLRDL